MVGVVVKRILAAVNRGYQHVVNLADVLRTGIDAKDELWSIVNDLELAFVDYRRSLPIGDVYRMYEIDEILTAAIKTAVQVLPRAAKKEWKKRKLTVPVHGVDRSCTRTTLQRKFLDLEYIQELVKNMQSVLPEEKGEGTTKLKETTRSPVHQDTSQSQHNNADDESGNLTPETTSDLPSQETRNVHEVAPFPKGMWNRVLWLCGSAEKAQRARSRMDGCRRAIERVTEDFHREKMEQWMLMESLTRPRPAQQSGPSTYSDTIQSSDIGDEEQANQELLN